MSAKKTAKKRRVMKKRENRFEYRVHPDLKKLFQDYKKETGRNMNYVLDGLLKPFLENPDNWKPL